MADDDDDDGVFDNFTFHGTLRPLLYCTVPVCLFCITKSYIPYIGSKSIPQDNRLVSVVSSLARGEAGCLSIRRH